MLSPGLRHKSAFTTICSKYQFLLMTFGLTQGPVHFTALMQKVLGQSNDICFFHMDNVLNMILKNYLAHLKMIFLKIREADLKLKLSKCAFLKRHLRYFQVRVYTP